VAAGEKPWYERAVEVGLRRLQLHRFPYLVYRISPGLGRVSVRAWYQHISRLDKQHNMTFMNYGFAGLDGAPPPALFAQDERDRYGIQLYHHLTSGIEMAGRDVLEVGSGRGGGCSYIARYVGPRSVTGLDVAGRAVDYCTSHHATAGLRFVQGDAEALPFAEGSFDVVINVESSHYYASMPRFLSEVRRVLRAGGLLLFTDFRTGRGLDTLRQQVAGSGFEVVREELITANVLLALQLDEERKLELINSKVPWLVRKVFKEFASTRGTATYESFNRRHWEYISFILRKPAA
jgi:ubiquinone/menaquinone biosynthesis C-methylase UbiE